MSSSTKAETRYKSLSFSVQFCYPVISGALVILKTAAMLSQADINLLQFMYCDWPINGFESMMGMALPNPHQEYLRTLKSVDSKLAALPDLWAKNSVKPVDLDQLLGEVTEKPISALESIDHPFEKILAKGQPHDTAVNENSVRLGMKEAIAATLLLIMTEEIPRYGGFPSISNLAALLQHPAHAQNISFIGRFAYGCIRQLLILPMFGSVGAFLQDLDRYLLEGCGFEILVATGFSISMLRKALPFERNLIEMAQMIEFLGGPSDNIGFTHHIDTESEFYRGLSPWPSNQERLEAIDILMEWDPNQEVCRPFPESTRRILLEADLERNRVPCLGPGTKRTCPFDDDARAAAKTCTNDKLGYDALEQSISGGDKTGNNGRRPYLPQSVLERLSSLNRSDLLHFFQPGEMIHVDMDDEEAAWIVRSVRSSRKRSRGPSYPLIADELVGRTADDVEAFVSDHRAGRCVDKQRCIIVGSDVESLPRRPEPECESTAGSRHVSRTHFLMKRALFGRPSQSLAGCHLGGYREVTSWSGCSGTVIQLATTSSSACLTPNGLYTCLIGSATETDPARQRPGLQDPYNRPGELVGLQLDATGLACRVLNGHWTVSPSDARVMRSTVSCVIHSDNNSAYVTGGFDGNIALWSDDKLACLNRFGSHGSPINAIAADSKTYGILYGTSKGELIWCADPLGSVDSSDGPPLQRICGPRIVQGQSLPFANSLDVLALTSGQRTRTRAFAGYGYLTGLKSGAVHTYDMTSLQAGESFKLDHERALTDISLHPEEHLLAVATGILFDDKGSAGDGKIRLYDLRSPLIPNIIQTPQNDIHRLDFSPSGDLIYSNDASSGLMLVHDFRYASRPIWSHSHHNGIGDHFMGHTWMPPSIAGHPSASGLLFTGGNDSILKLWDLGRPEALVEQHDLGQPINNIVVSGDGAMVWVGTEFGSIHLLSRNTSLPEGLGPNMTVSFD